MPRLNPHPPIPTRSTTAIPVQLEIRRCSRRRPECKLTDQWTLSMHWPSVLSQCHLSLVGASNDVFLQTL